jgi:PiT family inorganic phosphate transporter
MTAEAAALRGAAVAAPQQPALTAPRGRTPALIFFAVLTGGILFIAYSLYHDVEGAGMVAMSWLPWLLLFAALLIALGFEFVNGFHDTANAVATVIYTHSLPAPVAVVWSGLFNFLGVLASSGAVAFAIVALLPVELLLQVGSRAGFAMVFALLSAAIIWNLCTWYVGLPASSSHTLIGSIIGVGLANALMAGHDAGSGVDWNKATEIGWALILSPLAGFAAAALLLLALKMVARNPALYRAPEGAAPPPWWIRGTLIATCTGVSFAHGSNDGQKGMGLIMLILVGMAPTAYALNRAMPDDAVDTFRHASVAAAAIVGRLSTTAPFAGGDARDGVEYYLAQREVGTETWPALAGLIGEIAAQVQSHGSLTRLPADLVGNTRNDMFLASEAIRFLVRNPAAGLTGDDATALLAYKRLLDDATKFIPLWVKIAVAIALGLGTMVGWRRIVITVGEKIGKSHMTYAQGAAAELVAAGTIAAADVYGLPVSTTHVLSSGVAGAMAANGSGLQLATIRNLLLAWVLTLPAAIAISASLFWVFSKVL